MSSTDMTIQSFIEKADVVIGGTHASIEEVLLDPEAWKAVGKVEGWKTNSKIKGHYSSGPKMGLMEGHSYTSHSWLLYMHRMIDALAEGKTIEQYLETL